MKRIAVIHYLASAMLLASVAGLQAEPLELKAKPGSKVQIDGTSTVHDWTVEGKLIGGNASLPDGLPTGPGPVKATVKAFIPITSLKSVKNGKPYSTKMDEIMYEKLGKPDHKVIGYELDELTLKQVSQDPETPHQFESKGRLIVAGVTNEVTLPVEILATEDGQVKFSTKTTIKMTDYKIDPPAPKIALGLIKTGDEVDVSVEWVTAKTASQ